MVVIVYFIIDSVRKLLDTPSFVSMSNNFKQLSVFMALVMILMSLGGRGGGHYKCEHGGHSRVLGGNDATSR